MVKVNRERLWKHLEQIGAIGKDPRGGVSRFAWTKEYKEACVQLMKLMEDIGLQVRMDTVGNIYGRLEGKDPSLPPVLTGSHLDTVPRGGFFDGNAGIAASLECMYAMHEAGHRPHRSVELIAFVNEEASQFLGGHFGSRAICGMLPRDYLQECKHRETGQTLYDAMKEFGMGCDPDRFEECFIKKGDYYCFLELHIEQGRTLLDNNKAISVLTHIAGIKQFYITLHGSACHAGGMAMKGRHDTLAAAAQIVCEVERLALEGGVASRGTVGYIQSFPAEHNIVAEKSIIPVDFREIDSDIFERLYTDTIAMVEKQCRQRGLTYEVRYSLNTPPAVCHPKLVSVMTDVADSRDIPNMPMVSYPAHDAHNLSRLYPMGMIFLRSSNEGLSHCPDEYTTPEDMEAGTTVLLEGILKLAEGNIL